MDSGASLITAETLPDWLGPRMRLISVGLNPSPRSVLAQTYFAHPRNRFWPMLNNSGCFPDTFKPGPEAMRQLFDVYGMGFTDLVKRPTPGAATLNVTDYRQGALALRNRLAGYDADLIWFQGRLPWAQYLRHTEGGVPSASWGLQPQTFVGMPVWVTPNPSSANAAFTLPDLIAHFRALYDWLSREI